MGSLITLSLSRNQKLGEMLHPFSQFVAWKLSHPLVKVFWKHTCHLTKLTNLLSKFPMLQARVQKTAGGAKTVGYCVLFVIPCSSEAPLLFVNLAQQSVHIGQLVAQLLCHPAIKQAYWYKFQLNSWSSRDNYANTCHMKASDHAQTGSVTSYSRKQVCHDLPRVVQVHHYSSTNKCHQTLLALTTASECAQHALFGVLLGKICTFSA